MKKRKTCVTLFATDYISKSTTTHELRQRVTTASRRPECVELFLHSSIRRHGVVLKATTDNFTFMSTELSFAALEGGEMNGKQSRSSRS